MTVETRPGVLSLPGRHHGDPHLEHHLSQVLLVHHLLTPGNIDRAVEVLVHCSLVLGSSWNILLGTLLSSGALFLLLVVELLLIELNVLIFFFELLLQLLNFQFKLFLRDFVAGLQ